MKDNPNVKRCDLLTHVNMVEVGVKECPFCKLKLLTKEEYSN